MPLWFREGSPRGPAAAPALCPLPPCPPPGGSQASCLSPQEAWQLNRERELKEEIRKGRDQEIELVIHRLEADMTLAKEESERAAESR